MPADRPRCEACHRPLLRPSASGYGPVCERRRNARPAPRPVARASPAGPVPLVPGQVEIPLQPMQPSLWAL